MPARESTVVSLVAVQLCLLLGCSAGQDGAASPAEPSDPPAADAILRRGDFDRTLLLTGQLEAVRSISIKAPQTDQFQMRIQFMAEEGSLVAEGDPLLDFDNSSFADRVRELETQILDAETQIVSRRSELASDLKDLEIEIAEREYEYGRTKLEAEVDPEVLSRKEHGERQLAFDKATRELEETRRRIELTRERGTADLDVLQINRDKLDRDLESARKALELLSIKAPAAGLVVYELRNRSTLRYQEGDSCWPGQQVMRLPDLSEMQVAFDVNEVDAPLLRVGMPVRITLDAFPGRELGAELTRIPSMAVKRDDSSRIAVFKVIARLEETWVGEMKPGMSVRGSVIVERREDVPLVDRRAVAFDGTSYRLLHDRDEATQGPEIHPLARNADYYVVSDDEYAGLVEQLPGTPVRRATIGGG